MICFIDTETSGLNTWEDSLLQIAFILYDEEKRKFVDKFVSYVKPFNDDPKPNPTALEVNRLTEQMLVKFPNPLDVQNQMMSVFGKYIDKYDAKDKMFFCAYNSDFDWKVLQTFWKKCGKASGQDKNYFGSWFWKNQLDVMVLSSQFLKSERSSMKNFKQLTVANTLGIEFNEEDLHDALEDIKLMIKIYKKIGGFN